MADDLADLGVPRELIHVIHNPVPVPEIRARARAPLRHPWLSPGEPPVLLAVGKLDRSLARAVLATLQAPPARGRLRRRAESFSVDAAADRYLEVVSAARRQARRMPPRAGPAGRSAPREARRRSVGRASR